MAKTFYIGANNAAKKNRKMYIGVNDVAKTVKKAYIGVNNVARPFFSFGDTVDYYGQGTTLSTARYDAAAVSLDTYAIIAGGNTGFTTYTNSVEVYTPSLVKSSATALNSAKGQIGAARAGDYALFAGGYNGSGGVNLIEVYNKSLTKSTLSNLIGASYGLTGVSFNNCAVFAGSNSTSRVEMYDASLTKYGTTPYLSQSRTDVGGAAVGNSYVLFAGGAGSGVNGYTTVDAFNTSLTAATVKEGISNTASGVAGASMSTYALFAGGRTAGGTVYYTTEAYNSSLTKTRPASLYYSATNIGSTTLKDKAIFAGGNDFSNIINSVEMYSNNLVKTKLPYMSMGRQLIACVSIGDYAILSGGAASNYGPWNLVDVYGLA